MTSLELLIVINVAHETTRSQALPGNALVWRLLPPESQTKDAFRRGGASLAVSYQAEPGN